MASLVAVKWRLASLELLKAVGSIKQLLLVEDDDAISDVVQVNLSSAGFDVRRERDGLAALRAVSDCRFDLVLLDLMLPGADGWDICRQLRAQPEYVPIIMISARTTEAHRVLGLELGADDYLPKPFSVLELLARVRALLRRAERLRDFEGHGYAASRQREHERVRAPAVALEGARQLAPRFLAVREAGRSGGTENHRAAVWHRDGRGGEPGT